MCNSFNFFIITNNGEVLESELCKEQASMNVVRYSELHKKESHIGYSEKKVNIGDIRPACIVDGEDQLLESWLTLKEAEQLLCSYLNHEVDAYIGETADWI